LVKAVLKIVKHCNENLPSMVTGSLLGLDVDGILEVTYAYPLPSPKAEDGNQDGIQDEVDGQDYQMEMMKMLRDVHVDNNCVGWYQSMYMGTYCTNEVVGYQYSYQSAEELSDNSIVLLYDPIQSRKGTLVLKAFRLSAEYMKMRKYKLNTFIPPSNILEELPVKIVNSGHACAFLRTLKDTHASVLDCDLDHLALTAGDSFNERQLELMSSWIDDLTQEQSRLQLYLKSVSKNRQEQIRWLTKRITDNAERQENGEDELPLNLEESGIKFHQEAPPRLEPLLMLGQLDRYCSQVNEHADMAFHKLFLTSQFNTSSSAAGQST